LFVADPQWISNHIIYEQSPKPPPSPPPPDFLSG